MTKELKDANKRIDKQIELMLFNSKLTEKLMILVDIQQAEIKRLRTIVEQDKDELMTAVIDIVSK